MLTLKNCIFITGRDVATTTKFQQIGTPEIPKSTLHDGKSLKSVNCVLYCIDPTIFPDRKEIDYHCIEKPYILFLVQY